MLPVQAPGFAPLDDVLTNTVTQATCADCAPILTLSDSQVGHPSTCHPGMARIKTKGSLRTLYKSLACGDIVSRQLIGITVVELSDSLEVKLELVEVVIVMNRISCRRHTWLL